jgi:hypothetical protein
MTVEFWVKMNEESTSFSVLGCQVRLPGGEEKWTHIACVWSQGKQQKIYRDYAMVGEFKEQVA